MRGTWWRPALALGLFTVCACGAADNRVDPGDLALRDLLGIAPQVATAWDDDQRVAARHVLADALGDARATDGASTSLATGRSREERIARSLAVADGDRAGAGDGALALVHVTVAASTVTSEARRARDAAQLAIADDSTVPAPALAVELWLAPAWDGEAWATLPGRGLDVLGALAADAGHTRGPVVVVPAPRLAVAAAYVPAGENPAQLMVNPVLLASLEPDPLEGATVAGMTRAPAFDTAPANRTAAAGANGPGSPADPMTGPTVIGGTGGNPYSFYGSVAECAFVQRTRCEECMPNATCTPVTDLADGNAECTMLAADSGRGYFLLCINLSLAIASVDACTADEAPACPRDSDAGGTLAELNQNANFLDDPACAAGLDRCLADIFGAPPNPFPDLDGGTAPTDPPRNTTVSCGDSCDDNSNNGNCEASPSCSCNNDTQGPSCNNAFSCDSACSSSNEQSGCGGNCEACNASNDSGGSSSAGCGGCESDGSSGGSSGGGSCDSCSSDSGGSSGGGSCDSCSSDSGGSSGGGCEGGGCGGGDGGGGCGGGGGGGGDSCGGGGGGGGSSCNVQRRGPPAQVTLFVAALWGFLPVPAALLFRRKARRKKAAKAKPEVAS
ncbi:MAG TPA: hypothetical protein VM261_12185 [Kofleriaceae bacterium]|nr:hypothetical protein [Kofleriaceae bacterium]